MSALVSQRRKARDAVKDLIAAAKQSLADLKNAIKAQAGVRSLRAAVACCNGWSSRCRCQARVRAGGCSE